MVAAAESSFFVYVGLFFIGLIFWSIFQKAAPESPSNNIGEDPTLDSLKEKNKKALDEFLLTIKSSSERYYVDNTTTSFLEKILEGSSHAPKRYYYRWSSDSSVPTAIREYGEYVHKQVKGITEDLKEKERVHRDIQIASEVDGILLSNSEKIPKFLEIAYRKVVSVDEYGDENKEALAEEIVKFLNKLAAGHSILANELKQIEKSKYLTFTRDSYFNPYSSKLYSILHSKFDEYYAQQKSKTSNLDFSKIGTMTGVDFEQFLIELIKSCGVTEIRGTISTGDQGADILFKHNGTSVVVQAKRFSGSVGNKAIQEVHAAKGFYKCDRAWVITNSSFTKSALELAKELNVLLIDGSDLNRFTSKFKEYFNRAESA